MKRVFAAILAITISSGMALGQERKPNPKLERIIFVFKTHFDIGYTDLAERIVQKYSTSMILETLKTLDESNSMPPAERFRWTVPGWPMKEILDNRSGESKKVIDEAIREGRFVVHALPFTFETEAGTCEALVRGMQFSSKIARDHGLELPRDAKLTDVPSHSWFLPTLLKNAGVDFLQIGCNAASSSPKVPVLFWWEGPDGSRLMTLYWEAYYGTDIIPADDWPFKTWIAIIHTNDNVGPPPIGEVVKTLEAARKLAPRANLTIGRMSDFYDAIMKENPVLPVIKGDMPDTWIHGYMSMPREVKAAGMVKADAIGLEILGTQLGLWGAVLNDVTDKIKAIYEQGLLFDEHTFGLAMSHGASGYWCYGDEFRRLRSAGTFDKIELSWKEKGRHVLEAEILDKGTYSRKMDELAASVKAEGTRLVVYNPLPWSRTGWITLNHHSGELPKKMLRDLSTGRNVLISDEGNVITFMAEDVPPLGYKTYAAVADVGAVVGAEGSAAAGAEVVGLAEAEGNRIRLENEYLRVGIDRGSGQIVSLANKKSGREYVKAGTGYGMGEYLYERFGKENTSRYAKDYIKGGWDWAPAELGRINLGDDPYRSVTGSRPKVQLEKVGLSASVWLSFTATSGMPHDYSIRYRLVTGRPDLEVAWAISGKPADPWPEGGWLCFPLNIDNPRFMLGRTGGLSDPARDFVKGSNFDYCFVQEGLAVLDEHNSGIGLYSPDLPGISLERPGLWRYSRDFVPSKANVFFNLYNNQWSTNFTEWIEGSWNVRVYLWTIDDFDPERSLITPALERRHPLVAAVGGGQAGSLPATQPGLSLSEKGLLVAAFGPNPDGEGTLLRIWEKAGKSGKLVITLPGGSSFKRARPCNLRGVISRPPARVENRKIEVVYHPYQPLSFVLD
jgi:alpha-mannosidase